MRKNVFALARTPLGSLQRSPEPLDGFGGRSGEGKGKKWEEEEVCAMRWTSSND